MPCVPRRPPPGRRPEGRAAAAAAAGGVLVVVVLTVISPRLRVKRGSSACRFARRSASRRSVRGRRPAARSGPAGQPELLGLLLHVLVVEGGALVSCGDPRADLDRDLLERRAL